MQAEIISPEEAARNLAEYQLAGEFANALDREYPKQLWMVTVKSGIIYVRNLALEGMWGFVLHIDKVESIPLSARRSGGELLERFRISRGRNAAQQARDFLMERMQAPVLKLPSWAR